MNYKKALQNESEIAPQGGAGFFAFPVLWLLLAFAALTVAGFASNYYL